VRDDEIYIFTGIYKLLCQKDFRRFNVYADHDRFDLRIRFSENYP
jgi:hypothetical protein